MFNTLPFPWQGGHQCSLQLLIQPLICAPGTHYGWVDQGCVEYKVFPTLLHIASSGNRTLDLLILSLMPYLSTGPHAPVEVIKTAAYMCYRIILQFQAMPKICSCIILSYLYEPLDHLAPRQK